ncbi:MAG: TetR/AcrR family transcriptional regulator [Firmicutes bacterium]|nr:TetR/AcrR family transcriptional regulator [Bacillota bacterium]
MRKQQKEKRERILKEAGRLFLKNGYSDTKIIDIAKAAGVAKGTVYEYFPSKDDIVLEWIDTIMNLGMERTIDEVESKSTSVEKLKTYINMHMKHFHIIMLIVKVIMESRCYKEAANKDELIRGMVNKIDVMLKMFINIIEQGVENGEFRGDINIKFATAVIIGIMLSAEVCSHDFFRDMPSPPPISILDFEKKWDADMIMEFILNGMAAKSV